jgi:hypothetical protein
MSVPDFLDFSAKNNSGPLLDGPVVNSIPNRDWQCTPEKKARPQGPGHWELEALY